MELKHAPAFCSGYSRTRWCIDVVLAKAMRILPAGWRNRSRTVRLRSGLTITYRLNRGDLQSLRECLLFDHYRRPAGASSDAVLVDLGSNIGMAALALATKDTARLICVEPVGRNAALLRRNLEQNELGHALVLEAAVGNADGKAMFASHEYSNLGHLAATGMEVPVVSMASIFGTLPAETEIGILKIDIEGAEESILSGEPDWLERVRSVLIEIHQDRVSLSPLLETLERAGFIQAGEPRHEVWEFVRPRVRGQAAEWTT